MANITGSLASVNSVPTEGTVLVRALTLRPGSTFAVTGEPKVAVIKAGAFVIEDVEPGPVQLTIQGNGVTHDVRVDVPDEDEVDFLDLLEDVYEWEPAQISAVKLAAREARKAADEAGRIASAFRGAEQLEGWAESASGSAASAMQSAGEAAQSAGAAAGSAAEAAVSAGEAADSAGVATEQAGAAESSATSAAGSADEAGAAAERAGSSAAAAAASESAAEASATSAGRSATEASTHADRAEGVVDSVSWDDDRLTVAGKTSPSLRGPKGDRGEPGQDGTATVRGVALQGDGDDPAAGGLKSLAAGWGAKSDGDYSIAVGGGTTSGGNSSAALGYSTQATGDNSFSLGVYSRAEGDGSTAIGSASQARGQWSTAIGMFSRAEADGSTAIGPGHEVTAPGETHIGLPKSGVDNLGLQSSRVVLHGTVEATEPATEPEHLASKGDVDEVRAVAESRPAFFSGEGSPPSSIPGAVVGDYYLDETTMELHKITGV